MYCFADLAAEQAGADRATPAPLLPLPHILKLAEKRLRWYGLGDWQIRDVVCNAAPSVTVIARGPDGAGLALTISRDGGESRALLTQTPAVAQAPTSVPVRTAVVPHFARSLTTRAMDAISAYGSSCRLLTPAVCES
jgi:hypothetical protein